MSRITFVVLLGTLCFSSAKAWAEPHELKQLTDDRYMNGYSEWSPDGKWIIYTSAQDEGYLWRVSPEDGKSVKVSENNAHHGRFSPDGKYIVYDGDKGTVVRIMPSDGGGSGKALTSQLNRNVRSIAWDKGAQKIYFTVALASSPSKY